MPDVAEADWLCDHARLTVFPIIDAGAAPDGYWRFLSAADPDETISRPLERIESGVTDGLGLQVMRIPDRVHFRFAPPPTDAPATFGLIPMVGDAPAALARLRACADTLGQSAGFPNFGRVAVGLTAARAAQDHATAYASLGDHLGLRLGTPGVSDLSYRINRPRDWQYAGRTIRINRLCGWSIFRWVARQEAPAGTRDEIAGLGGYGWRLEVDFNIAPESAEQLPAAALPAVVARLVSEVSEVLIRGDVE
jgi:hypothetical protein